MFEKKTREGIKERVAGAKIRMMNRFPFFGYVAMHLNEGAEIKQQTNVPTACVDYKGEMRYNPRWMEKLSDEEVMAVIAHEASHVVLLHLMRLKNRHLEIFNIATDMVINNLLVQNGFRLPKDALIPYNNSCKLGETSVVIHGLDEKSSEEVYDELYRELDKKNLIKWIKGRFGMDEHIYSPIGEEGETQEKKWKEKLVEAMQHAKKRGCIPKGMERLYGGILEGKVDWRSLLYRYVSSSVPYDYTWAFPSKKSFCTGVYMPSVKRESVEVVVSIDTSGSISQEELTQFLSEIVRMGKAFAQSIITVLVGDATLEKEYVVRGNDISKIISLRMVGGGGTSHKFVMDYIREKKPKAKCLIMLTDGYSDIQNAIKGLPRTCDSIICLPRYSCNVDELKGCGRIIKMRD